MNEEKHIKFHAGLVKGGFVYSLIVFPDSDKKVIVNSFTKLMQNALEKKGIQYNYCPLCGKKIE